MDKPEKQTVIHNAANCCDGCKQSGENEGIDKYEAYLKYKKLKYYNNLQKYEKKRANGEG